jgi:MFS family permease
MMKLPVRKEALVVVLTLFVALFFVMGGSAFTVGLFFPPLIKTFHWSHARLSFMYTAFALAMGLSSPFAGWLIDRTGARNVMVVGAAMVAGGYLFGSQIHSFGALIVAFLVIGTGVGASTLVPTAVVAANWFSEQRGLALGVSIAGSSIGGMVMPLAVNHIISIRGWRTALMAIAVPIVLLAMPLIWFGIRMRPATSNALETREETSLPGLDVGPALKTVSFWMLALMQVLAGLGLSGTYYHIVPYLVDAGYSSAQAAYVVSLQAGAVTLGFLTMGYLTDRFGVRKVLPAALLIEGLGVLSLIGAQSQALAVLFIAVFLLAFGITAGATSSLVPIILAESLGLKRYGTLSGLINLCATVGGSVGPVAVGRIFDATRSYERALEVCSITLVLAAIAPLFVYPAEGILVNAPAALGSHSPH